MNKPLLVAATIVAAILAQVANAATFSVLEVSAALKGSYQDASTSTLANFNLSTKTLINIALNKDIGTAVPKNIVLGYAGIFSDFANHNPNTTGPVRLVVYDTDTQTNLKTIAVASNRTVAENVVIDKFRRVSTATLTIQDTSAGATTGHLLSGTLQASGSGTRKPNAVATPTNLKVTGVVSVGGSLVFHYTKGSDAKTITLIVPKGTIKVNSKVIGTYEE
jgi:hypothetical protein